MNRNTQLGGTFLGLIIGLVLGLGIALAVAIYVTKVSVPFSNKTRPADTAPTQESDKLKDWNPNTVLQPKPPASAPQTGEGSAGTETPADGTAGTPAAAPAAPSVPPAPAKAPAVSADPLGDLVKSRSGLSTPAPTAQTAAADPFHYFVQAGAFRTAAEADAQKAKLALLGLDARVSERDQGGRVVYRVRIGAFEDKDSAEKIKARLDGQGIEAVMVRVQK